jgi:hypothetical protein
LRQILPPQILDLTGDKIGRRIVLEYAFPQIRVMRSRTYTNDSIGVASTIWIDPSMSSAVLKTTWAEAT